MTFLIYETFSERGAVSLRPTDEIFKLNWLLQNAWNEKGRPINRGWGASADELIRIHTGGQESYRTRRLLSDFHPSSTERIGMIELLHVFAFTWTDDGQIPTWTPFMVKGRDVFYKSDYENLSDDDKKKVVADLPEFDPEGQEFVEFLYSRVNRNGNWVWGRTGMANAPFLYGEARKYFHEHF
jgi:hypothetical protein